MSALKGETVNCVCVLEVLSEETNINFKQRERERERERRESERLERTDIMPSSKSL